MTSTEIIKALRCGEDANGTPCTEPSDGELVCYDTLKLAAADLIERLEKKLQETREQVREMEDALETDECTLAEMLNVLEAYKEGRVLVLPCKVGDIVYGFRGDRTILPMVAKWIETNTDGWCVVAQYAPMAPKFYQFSDFGKTVSLTRGEAEKALEARKDGYERMGKM